MFGPAAERQQFILNMLQEPLTTSQVSEKVQRALGWGRGTTYTSLKLLEALGKIHQTGHGKCWKLGRAPDSGPGTEDAAAPSAAL